MIEDIAPHRLNNQFQRRQPDADDWLIAVDGDQVLMSEGARSFPRVAQLRQRLELVYLFEIDGTGVFLTDEPVFLPQTFWVPASMLRHLKPSVLALAGVTALQIAAWRKQRQFCGCCGGAMRDSETERARICKRCGHIEYPTIAPCVITAVIDRQRGRLLVVRNPGRDHLALVAGYVEVAETLEDAVRREVWEEVGLRTGKLTYYGSQPWAFSSSQMAAFVSELQGEAKLRLQKEEIAEAMWLKPQQLPDNPDPLSIGHQMMQQFRQGRL